MSSEDQTTTTARRAPAQRWVAARYDGAHALLVRLVHPMCFSAFALIITVVVGGLAYLLLDSLDGDAIMVVVVFGGLAIIGAFKFVATPVSVGFGVVALAGWSLAMFVMDEVPSWLLWVLVVMACWSILIQVVLLARVVPDRWHNGLMHLLWPSALGTIIGSIPVWSILFALALGERAGAQRTTAIVFLAGCVVLLVLLVAHLYGRRHDATVLAEFAGRHGWETVTADEPPEPINRLTPKFGTHTPWWRGKAGERDASVVTGYTASWAADVPSLHLTVLGIGMRGAGRDVWVRRTDWSHDNVLASLGRSEVMRFESITLSERYAVRFPAGTHELDAFRAFGPQLVDLLGRGLGDAQVCRIGDALLLFVVGGVLDADELDAVLDTGCQIAALLERDDAARARDAEPEPVTS